MRVALWLCVIGSLLSITVRAIEPGPLRTWDYFAIIVWTVVFLYSAYRLFRDRVRPG